MQQEENGNWSGGTGRRGRECRRIGAEGRKDGGGKIKKEGYACEHIPLVVLMSG